MIQQPIPVPPAPKLFHCTNHPNKEANIVILQESVSHIVCEDCRLRYYAHDNFFLLDKVFQDILETFRHTKLPYHSIQYMAQYLLNQQSNWSDQTIDEWGDKLIENINDAINVIKTNLKSRLKRFNEYFSDYSFKDQLKQALKEISQEYSILKERVSQIQENDVQTIEEAKAAIQDYCDQIYKLRKTKDSEMKNNEVYIIAENIRTKQQLFMNQNVLLETEAKMKQALTYVKDNFLSDNKFLISKIANCQIMSLFERIQPDEVNRNKLITSIELIFQKMGNEDSLKLADMRSQILDNNVLILVETKSQQKFGLYYNTGTPNRSLLCSLTKNSIFQTRKSAQLVIPKPAETAEDKPIIQYGEDFVIDNSLQTGRSLLGDIFDIRGHEIGDTSEYLADGQTFDISKFEIFKITDRSINVQNPAPQPQPQPQLQQQPPGQFAPQRR